MQVKLIHHLLSNQIIAPVNADTFMSQAQICVYIVLRTQICACLCTTLMKKSQSA